MKPIQFHEGERVNIFQDPITQRKHEGVATLKRFVGKDDKTGIEDWEVQFNGEEETFQRAILDTLKTRIEGKGG